ncbi:hypothetical protein AcW2_006649 [Taiwanofungus camphoratus]|nr:hypothetical protein AcW2_006649 [Antrodia cinnamomea]
MSSDAGFSHGDETSGAPPQRTIRLTVPERYYLLPGAGILAGTTIGLLRGSRLASLRFLAENVHRPPTTVKGWYFYNKTKNYRVMMGGLREAGVQALRLGTTAAGWVCIEEACARLGWGDVSEVAAGLGTAGVFAAVYRLPWKAARRTMVLGVMIGAAARGLRWGQDSLKEQARARKLEVEAGASEGRKEVMEAIGEGTEK